MEYPLAEYEVLYVSKLYLSGIEIEEWAVEAPQKMDSKLYLSGIEIHGLYSL